jgi:hypothetical protein
MPSPFRAQCEKWKLDEALLEHPGLSLRPPDRDGLWLHGRLTLDVRDPRFPEIQDAYEVDIHLPNKFPAELPIAVETGGRIPETFHKNDGGALCLGSEARQKLLLGKRPTLLLFISKCLIPYLYGYSHNEQFGKLPFGALRHGRKGIVQDYMSLFGIKDQDTCIELLALASMRKRNANKKPCPCQSGRRVGRCHNRVLNHYRRLFGRKWFSMEHRRLSAKPR